MASQSTVNVILKLIALWIALLILPLTERALFRSQNLLWFVYWSRVSFRRVRTNDPFNFRFSAAYKAGAVLRLDYVSGVVRRYLLRSCGFCHRI